MGKAAEYLLKQTKKSYQRVRLESTEMSTNQIMGFYFITFSMIGFCVFILTFIGMMILHGVGFSEFIHYLKLSLKDQIILSPNPIRDSNHVAFWACLGSIVIILPLQLALLIKEWDHKYIPYILNNALFHLLPFSDKKELKRFKEEVDQVISLNENKLKASQEITCKEAVKDKMKRIFKWENTLE